MKKTYLAITIGPVFKTIQRARKTRELWAASFILSQYMRTLLLALKDYGKALSPDITAGKLSQKFRGAGIWNDNCFFELHDDQAPILREKLQDILTKAKADTISLLLMEDLKRKKKADDPEAGELRDVVMAKSALETILTQFWHCHAVLLEADPSAASGEDTILLQLGKMLNSLEMQATFMPQFDDMLGEVLFRKETVHKLYILGYEPDDTIFTYYDDLNRERKRLPSLLEIATRAMRNQAFYQAVVKDSINRRVARGDHDDLEDKLEEQQIISGLKSKMKEAGLDFKKRFKYVAVVQSDGDGIGELIKNLGNDPDIIQKFSSQLMAFSTEAVGHIAQFGGVPVYAGGDDLLFIAPLQNEADKSIFDLIDEINTLFGEKVEGSATLSFGVSISYYKHPLGEALATSRDLLKYGAKQLNFRSDNLDCADEKDKVQYAAQLRKKALAFRVLTHSGQSFGTVMRMDGETYKNWRALLSASGGEDMAFTSGVVHTLEPLEILLEDACRHEIAEGTDRSEWFFEHHFNEAKTTDRWGFVQSVRKLAKSIHGEYRKLCVKDEFYNQVLDKPDQFQGPEASKRKQTQFRNDLLYSALRMIQFLNANDHE